MERQDAQRRGAAPCPAPAPQGGVSPGPQDPQREGRTGSTSAPHCVTSGSPALTLRHRHCSPPRLHRVRLAGARRGQGFNTWAQGAPVEPAVAPPPRLRSLQKQVGAWGLAGAELPGSDSQIRVCRREPRLPRRGAKSAHSRQRAGNNWGLSGWRPGAGGPSRAGGVGWGSSEQGLQQRQESGALLLPPLLPPAAHTHPH